MLPNISQSITQSVNCRISHNGQSLVGSLSGKTVGSGENNVFLLSLVFRPALWHILQAKIAKMYFKTEFSLLKQINENPTIARFKKPIKLN